MKTYSSFRKKVIRKVFLITILIGFLSINTSVFRNTAIIPCSTAAGSIEQWNLTLTMNESGGTSCTVVFGQHTNASDGQDMLDIPAPPMSPILPVIAAWFETSLPLPYDKLLYEFKPYPSLNSSWNLSVLWLPPTGNTTPTEITLHWDSSELRRDTISSLLLYDNNSLLANMLTTKSYTYETDGTAHRFQILSESQPTNDSSDQDTIPLLPVLIVFVALFIVGIIVLFLRYRPRKKSQVSENRSSQIGEEIKATTIASHQSQDLEQMTTKVVEKKKPKTAKKKSQVSKKKPTPRQRKSKK